MHGGQGLREAAIARYSCTWARWGTLAPAVFSFAVREPRPKRQQAPCTMARLASAPVEMMP